MKIRLLIECGIAAFVALAVHADLIYFFAVYGLCRFLWSPRGYAVSGGAVMVRRRVGDVSVSGVLSCHRLSTDGLPRALWTWAFNGVLVDPPEVVVATLGTCRWYVTNLANAVVLTTDTGTAVVSPDRPDLFVATLQAAAQMPSAC